MAASLSETQLTEAAYAFCTAAPHSRDNHVHSTSAAYVTHPGLETLLCTTASCCGNEPRLPDVQSPKGRI